MGLNQAASQQGFLQARERVNDMTTISSESIRDLARIAVIVLGIIIVLAVAQQERGRSNGLPSGIGEGAPAGGTIGHAEAIRAQMMLQETEARLAVARDDLAGTIARLDERIKALDEAEREEPKDAPRPVAVIGQDARERDRIDAELIELRKRFDEATADAMKTRQELERFKADAAKAIVAPQAAAARPQVEQGDLGRGRIVDQQTKFDRKRFRDPAKPGYQSSGAESAAAGSSGSGGGGGGAWAGSTAYGDMLRGQGELVRGMGNYNLDTSKALINLQAAKSLEMENRMRWTETFFEMRRVNRTNRAFEAGPRPTMEQVVTYARMQAPRRLTSIEVDPVTGDISWPRVLTDSMYTTDREFLQEQFRLRANGGGSVDFAQFETVEAAVSAFNDKLKANVSKYPPAKYGEARTFLDSLRREFELPVSQ